MAIAIVVQHDYDALKTAPEDLAATEVVNQYGRALKVIKELTGWIRNQGWGAEEKGGPMAGSMVMILAAIKAGFGELGWHASMVHQTFGENFRLALVLTNKPLEKAGEDVFGADDFCSNCRVCSDARRKRWPARSNGFAALKSGTSISTNVCHSSTKKGLWHLYFGMSLKPSGGRQISGQKMARRRARAGTSYGT